MIWFYLIKLMITSSESPLSISPQRCSLSVMLKIVCWYWHKIWRALKFSANKAAKKVENFQLFFQPNFSALFLEITESHIYCACKNWNPSRIFRLHRFFHWMEKTLMSTFSKNLRLMEPWWALHFKQSFHGLQLEILKASYFPLV